MQTSCLRMLLPLNTLFGGKRRGGQTTQKLKDRTSLSETTTKAYDRTFDEKHQTNKDSTRKTEKKVLHI